MGVHESDLRPQFLDPAGEFGKVGLASRLPLLADRRSESEGLAWRERLLQRLLVATTPIIAAAVLMAIAATHGHNRWWLSVLLPCIPMQIAAACSRGWSFRVRASILIAPLILAVYVAYLRVGFKGNASLIGAAAVVLTGFLFGRRSMTVLVGFLLLAPILVGVGMTSGYLPSDGLVDMAPTRVEPWVRTTFVSLSIWLVLGFAVTFVVQSIESALGRTRQALIDLRAEEQLREQAERARLEAQEAAMQAQKIEIVGRLSAGVAHDFNNLLGVVASWSSIMVDESVTPAERGEARAALDAVVQHGSSLTRQLLALARQDSRIVGRVSLEAAAKTGVLALQRVLPPRIKLTFDELSPAWVEADATEMQQILFNLVLNARDAIPESGTVRVTVDVETLSEPLSGVGGTLAAGRWAKLSVKDSGTGIDPSVRDRIFELFFTTKPVGLGTGLGLATVLRIAKASGGAVGLDSQPGNGSTFTLYLPCLA